MKKTLALLLFLLLAAQWVSAQAPHLFEHDYPIVMEEDSRVRALMNQVSVDSIVANIEHLSSYHTRRYDSRFIYDVQDWLYGQYLRLDLDTVYKHDFKLVGLGQLETADNIIAIQYGTTHPEEFVVCGAHYDSYAWDGYDPDTIRSPGADDNASGVAGIWETARVLSRCRFERSIIYCLFCAEECGLQGSAAFAKDCAEQRMDIVGYFNMDMNGYLAEGNDIHVNLIYTTQDSTFADYFYRFSRTYFPEMPIYQSWLSGGDSDFSSFNRNGYAALFPHEDTHASSPYIHSRNDVLGMSVNNLEQSKRFAELNLGAVAILAGLEDAAVDAHEKAWCKVYPNPATNSININADVALRQVMVFNAVGQQMAQHNFNGMNSVSIDASNYHSGIYMLRIVTDHGVWTERLVVR